MTSHTLMLFNCIYSLLYDYNKITTAAKFFGLLTACNVPYSDSSKPSYFAHFLFTPPSSFIADTQFPLLLLKLCLSSMNVSFTEFFMPKHSLYLNFLSYFGSFLKKNKPSPT